MVTTLYCWRCKKPMPMLDEEEFAWVTDPFTRTPSASERLSIATEEDARQLKQSGADAVLARWLQLTGMSANDIGFVWHHRLSRYGPPCANCGRPLRTPRARCCAECGLDAGSP